MAELHLVPASYAHGPRTLGVTPDPDPGVVPLASVSDEGEITVRGLDQDEDASLRIFRELRRPSNLVDLIEDEDGPRRWQAARLLLGVWKEMRRDLDREADRWTRTLLFILQARASLRIFAATEATDPEPWDRRATQDLLDAAAALEFFDPGRLAPFLQWLVAVLSRDRVRALIDGLLPVDDPAFIPRLTESGHQELQRVVRAVARAQRRQYYFGRYDLRGAGRLRSLLGNLRYPRSKGSLGGSRGGNTVRARALICWLFVADRCVPRLLAGSVVGILPFLITDEAWRLASELAVLVVGGLAMTVALAVLGYLAYDRRQADPAGLSPFSNVVGVWLTGIAESLGLAGVVQWLAMPSFHAALGYPNRFNAGVFLASAAFALGVGVFTQLIWQDKAVTAPP